LGGGKLIINNVNDFAPPPPRPLPGEGHLLEMASLSLFERITALPLPGEESLPEKGPSFKTQSPETRKEKGRG